MSHAPIMPFYTDAYLADTHHLNAECQGAYLLLLLHTWRCNGAPPPDDDRILARIARVPPARWKRSVRPQLEPFFHRTDGSWRQKRLEKEWARACEKIEQQRQKACKSNWLQQQRKHLPPQHSITTEADTQRPPSINQSPNSNPFHNVISNEAEPPSPIPTPALTALKPILNDIRYFVVGGLRLSPSLRPQLQAAITEARTQLAPMSADQAHAQIHRLDAHFPKRADAASHAARLSDYITQWQHWPTDIGASTLATLLATHPYPTLPPLSTCLEKATPLLTLRQTQLTRLEKLLERMGD